jgi:bifunctional non-homologous end joining protein LigD
MSSDPLADLPETPAPNTASAMKAVLTDERFSDPAWIYERKLDGIRCIAIRDGSSLRMLSRNDLSMNDRYPEVAKALASMKESNFAIDGEVVAFKGSETSFAKLAEARRTHARVFYYVFDIVWLEGHDVRKLPLLERKRLLRRYLKFPDPIRFTPHRNGDGVDFYKEACRKGWEGLIAKRADSPYVTTRSRDWLKFKCEHGQELVIGGFTAPRRSREEFGALLLGYYRDGDLIYAGKVGTGFDRATLHELGQKMRELERDTRPFAGDDKIPGVRGATWIEPKLVAEVGFTEWTNDGRLRHPRFLGLRDDKAAREVVRESASGVSPTG